VQYIKDSNFPTVAYSVLLSPFITIYLFKTASRKLFVTAHIGKTACWWREVCISILMKIVGSCMTPCLDSLLNGEPLSSPCCRIPITYLKEIRNPRCALLSGSSLHGVKLCRIVMLVLYCFHHNQAWNQAWILETNTPGFYKQQFWSKHWGPSKWIASKPLVCRFGHITLNPGGTLNVEMLLQLLQD